MTLSQALPSLDKQPAFSLSRESFSPRREHDKTSTTFALCGLLCLSSIAWFQPKFSVVSGASMSPTLPNKTLTLAAQNLAIKRFDIVTFEDPAGYGPVVKRVVGLPGETVEFHHDGLYINGKHIQEPGSLDSPGRVRPYKIPEGYAYVVGDNRLVSADSRDYGAVALSGMRRVIVNF